MQLTSRAFDDGDPIPEDYTCDGDAVSPPLRWSDVPSGTKSFVILCEDPDAPSGTFEHWVAYDIPANKTSLSAGTPQKAKAGAFKQGVNGFDKIGYGAPCPPKGEGSHRYNFYVWALDVDQLNVSGNRPSYDDIKKAAKRHKIGSATLTGRYER